MGLYLHYLNFVALNFKEKIKKLNKKKLIVLLAAISICIILPLEIAHGQLAGETWAQIAHDSLLQAIDKGLEYLLVAVFLQVILQIILALSNFLLGLAGGLLNWAITLNTSIPLTRCASGVPCIVDTGWTFTRDIANMFFILALVIIAFATILGIESYGMRRLLVPLILIAILLNFSQVFIGVVVDIANVLIETFAKPFRDGFSLVVNGFQQQTATFTNDVGEGMWVFDWTVLALWNIAQVAVKSWIWWLLKGLMLAIFNLLLAIILFLLAGIFLLRIPMLWALTIISPFFIVLYLFPYFKSKFRWWLDQTLEWTFIGVFTMFFLYLGYQLMIIMNDSAFKTQWQYTTFRAGLPPEAGGASLESWLVTNILPYIVFVIFLLLAFNFAKQTNAIFAGALVAGAVALRGQVEGRLKRMPSYARMPAKELRLPGAAEREARGLERRARFMERIPGLRGRAPALREEVYKKTRGYIEEGEKRGEKISPQEAARMYWNNALNDPYKNLGLMSAQSSNLEDFWAEGRRRGHSDPEITRRFNENLVLARRYHDPTLRKIVKGDPRLAQAAIARERVTAAARIDEVVDPRERAVLNAISPTRAEEVASVRLWMREQVKPGDLKDTEAASFDNATVADAFLRYGKLDHFTRLGYDNPRGKGHVQDFINMYPPRAIQARYPELHRMISNPVQRRRLESAGWRFP